MYCRSRIYRFVNTDHPFVEVSMVQISDIEP